MSADASIRIAAKMMAERLRVWKRLQQQARERGDSLIDLDVAELFEARDLEALTAYESALDEINGARPLPFGEIA